MTSEELQSEIIEKVADRLDLDAYRREGEEAVRNCPECRQAYEEELQQKMVVRKRYDGAEPATTVPDALERSIAAISQAETRRRSTYSRHSRSSGKGVPIFIFLLLILALAGYIILFDDAPSQPDALPATSTEKRVTIPEPTRRSTGPVNLFNQAMANYEALMGGALQVEYEEDDLASLKTLLSQQGIPPIIFNGASLQLIGGVVSERGGVKLPHFLYRDDEARLYVTEIPLATLKEGKGFYVTDDVLAQVEGGSPIWLEATGKGNLVMYKQGEEVIVAVANRSSVEMKKMLKLP